MPIFRTTAGALALATLTGLAHAGPTLDTVKKRGYVQCGVSTGIQGFSSPDSKGNWQGLDVDMCRAIAATVFNDASKFRLTPLTTQARFTALQSGEVDVLTRNVTPTMARDTTLGLISTCLLYTSWIIAASAKYSASRPRMAKMLLVYTMKGSVVMAKIAGTESTANSRSTNSINTLSLIHI